MSTTKLTAGHRHHCSIHHDEWICRNTQCDRAPNKICDECWESRPTGQSSPTDPPPRQPTMGEVLGLKPEIPLTPEEQAAYRQALRGGQASSTDTLAVDEPATQTGEYGAAHHRDHEQPTEDGGAVPITEEASPMSTNAPVKTPKAKAPKAAKRPKVDEATPAPVPEATAPATTSATRRTEGDLSIKADVLTYAPDHHRARIHITTPERSYYKLVPGIKYAQKAEALTAALAFRDQIFTTGEVPTPGSRQDKAVPQPTPAPEPKKTTGSAIRQRKASDKPTRTTAKGNPVKGMPGVTRVEVD